MRSSRAISLLAVTLVCTCAQAQPQPQPQPPATPPAIPTRGPCGTLRETATMKSVQVAGENDVCKLVPASIRDRIAEEGTSNFLDHLGAGLSLTIDTGDHDRIDTATLVNGIVRVQEDSNVRARFMGEIHFALSCENGALIVEGKKRCDPTERSGGLFLAVQPGSDNIIEGVGLGWMLRLPDKLFDRALNIGLGVFVEENVQILGDGVVANQPLPAGETEIRFRNSDQTAVLFMVSLDVGSTD
jgi:hypothetical protein